MRILAIATALLISSPVQAQPAAECSTLQASYERQADRIARLRAESQIRTQVVEATANATAMSNEIALLQVDLELMKGAGCPLPRRPINIDAYMPAIRACAAAPMNAPNKFELCDRANWKPAPAP